MAKLKRIIQGTRAEGYKVTLRERRGRGADESIIPYVIPNRVEASKLASRIVDAGFELKKVKVRAKKPDAELFSKEQLASYSEEAIPVLRLILKEPIRVRDYKKVEAESVRMGLLKDHPSKFPLDKIKLVTFNMLTDTSKMGCFSFNLPAGPKIQDGACPAAGLGFMFLGQKEIQKHLRLIRSPVPVDQDRFICNGCYAIKAMYAYTSMVVGQALRFEITKRWLKSGEFVERMVSIIQSNREHSHRRYEYVPKEFWSFIPDPYFFRIHDAGDFFSAPYAQAWMQICRKFPDVLFWAPTRMWSFAGSGGDVLQKGIPANVSIRPSALHFREDPPPVLYPGTASASVYGASFPGMSAGSGSGKVIPPGVWECPAYEHTSRLGGGLGDPNAKKTHGGTCPRAHGPFSPARGGSDIQDAPVEEGGHGCRACWKNKDLPIFYHEH